MAMSDARLPAQVDLAFKALANETRVAILLDLVESGEKTFSELKQRQGLDASSMTNHLKALMEGALVRNYYKKIPNEHQHSFYDATNFGREMLTTVAEVVSRYFMPGVAQPTPVEKTSLMEQEAVAWRDVKHHTELERQLLEPLERTNRSMEAWKAFYEAFRKDRVRRRLIEAEES